MAGDLYADVRRRLISRCELFDEADLDAALARFDELSRPAPRLENAASQVMSASRRASRPATGTPWPRFGRRHFDDDRRRVVDAGLRRGRDAEIEDMRAIADLGVTSTDVDRHCDPWGTPRPQRTRYWGRDEARCVPRRGAQLVEIDADDRIAASSSSTTTTSTPLRELDARYLAGEAAAHAHTWSVIAQAYAASTGANSPRRCRTG